MAAVNKEPKRMLSRDGAKVGETVNMRSRPCQMEGCTGMRICVRWPDGKRTYPCSKGCKVVDDDTLQIV